MQRGVLTTPEDTFYHSYGGHSGDWDRERRAILAAQRPWEQRTNASLFFRGSGAGYRHYLPIGRDGTCALSAGMHFTYYPRELAVGPPPAYVSAAQHCAEKYLVHLPGTWPSHSNKLKTLLACGAVILMPQNNWYEWYVRRPSLARPTLRAVFSDPCSMLVSPSHNGIAITPPLRVIGRWYQLLTPFVHFVPTKVRSPMGR